MPFQLQFDPSEIRRLAARYSYKDEKKAFEAGRQIAAGAYRRQHLEAIFSWKTKGRGISRLSRNSDDEIADALRVAVAARTERSATAVLMGLNGVRVPVASAVLTMINPERYTIIDNRALAALGVGAAASDVNLYLAYLFFCRRLAADHGVSLRELDRALWQWSKERGLADGRI